MEEAESSLSMEQVIPTRWAVFRCGREMGEEPQQQQCGTDILETGLHGHSNSLKELMTDFKHPEKRKKWPKEAVLENQNMEILARA